MSLDIDWYKKQQVSLIQMAWQLKSEVHPLVARILAVVEGTSPARIAECLGTAEHFRTFT